jgi:cytochrome c oxidase subunit 2
MVVVIVVVWALVLFALIRYRAGRRRSVGRKSDAKIIEALYALVLATIAGGLVAFTFGTEDRVDRLSPSPGARVHVVAFKWQWRFSYPGEAIAPIVGTDEHTPELVVPTNTIVRFTLTSRDVIHALWIPELRFKRDAFPKRTTQFDLVFDRPRRLVGRCAEFCGLDHAEMTLRIRAVPRGEYRAWLVGQGR